MFIFRSSAGAARVPIASKASHRDEEKIHAACTRQPPSGSLATEPGAGDRTDRQRGPLRGTPQMMCRALASGSGDAWYWGKFRRSRPHSPWWRGTLSGELALLWIERCSRLVRHSWQALPGHLRPIWVSGSPETVGWGGLRAPPPRPPCRGERRGRCENTQTVAAA